MGADTWEIKPDFLLLDWGGTCSPGSPVGWSSSVSLSLASEDFSSQLSPVYPPSINVVKFQCVLTSLPMSIGINYLFCLCEPTAISVGTVPRLTPTTHFGPIFLPGTAGLSLCDSQAVMCRGIPVLSLSCSKACGICCRIPWARLLSCRLHRYTWPCENLRNVSMNLPSVQWDKLCTSEVPPESD